MSCSVAKSGKKDMCVCMCMFGERMSLKWGDKCHYYFDFMYIFLCYSYIVVSGRSWGLKIIITQSSIRVQKKRVTKCTIKPMYKRGHCIDRDKRGWLMWIIYMRRDTFLLKTIKEWSFVIILHDMKHDDVDECDSWIFYCAIWEILY